MMASRTRPLTSLWPPRSLVREDLAPLADLAYPLTWIACLSVISAGVLARFHFVSVWDDSFMFARYADNVLHYGALAWNPGGEPTFGLTAGLFLSIVIPVRLLISENPLMTVVLSSIIGGALFIDLLVLLIAHEVPASPRLRAILVTFTLLALVFNVYSLLIHLTSGMDTTFALAYITAYIMLAVRFRRAPTRLRTVGLGIAGGMAFAVRPDLLIYSRLVPLAMMLFDERAAVRRAAAAVLALTVGLTAVQAAGAAWYFHSPVPLPFYAKALPIYGDTIREVYRELPAQQLSSYVQGFALLILLAAGGAVLDLRDGWRTPNALERGLLAATILFAGYYLLFVTQIMPRGQRFYYPTLPALVWLAAHGLVSIGRRLPARARAIVRAPAAVPALLVACLVLLMPIGRSQLGTLRYEIGRGRFGDMNPQSLYDWGGFLLWFQLDAFSKLPDDFVMATTEVGLPGALNPRKVIVDLAGLNETDFARSPFSARVLFAKYAPDLIYMPHPDYKDMTAEFVNDPYFISDYERVPLPAVYEEPFSLGIAIRRDSRYYADMRRIIAAGLYDLRTSVP